MKSLSSGTFLLPSFEVQATGCFRIGNYEIMNNPLLPPAPRAQISTSYHCGHRSKSSSPDILKIGIWLYPKALNLTETQRRGYFAANYDVYSRRYLESHGLGRETRWGMSVQNHMSGGPVLDSSGYLVGVAAPRKKGRENILNR